MNSYLGSNDVEELQGFLVVNGVIAFLQEMCKHGFDPEDHNRGHFVLQGPNHFYTFICRKKSELYFLYIFVCIYMYLFIICICSKL